MSLILQGPGPSTRNTRNTRRPQYNEDSEDESLNRPKRHQNGQRHHTRAGRQDSQSFSDNDDDDDDYEENSVSVSSRGRVRKISAKARGLFRE